jgi:hypothetical protein
MENADEDRVELREHDRGWPADALPYMRCNNVSRLSAGAGA